MSKQIPNKDFEIIKKMIEVWIQEARKEGGIPLVVIFGRQDNRGTDEFRYSALPFLKAPEVKSILQQVIDNWDDTDEGYHYMIGRL